MEKYNTSQEAHNALWSFLARDSERYEKPKSFTVSSHYQITKICPEYLYSTLDIRENNYTLHNTMLKKDIYYL